jgi:hypothetical protein
LASNGADTIESHKTDRQIAMVAGSDVTTTMAKYTKLGLVDE